MVNAMKNSKLSQEIKALYTESEQYNKYEQPESIGSMYSSLTTIKKELDRIQFKKTRSFILQSNIKPTIDIMEQNAQILLHLKEMLPHRVKYNSNGQKPLYAYDKMALQSGYHNSFIKWQNERGKPFEKYPKAALCFHLFFNKSDRLTDYDNLDIKPIIDAIATYIIVDDNPIATTLSFQADITEGSSFVEILIQKR